MTDKRRSVLRYAVAIGACAAAIAVKASPLPIGRETPFLFLLAPIVLAAWYGGRGPGLVALALMAIGADYLFLPPYGSLRLRPSAALQLAAFLTEAALVCGVTLSTRGAHARAVAAALQSKRDEERLRRLGRAYHALATCNEVLVRVAREEGLLQEICQAIVDVAGYRLCWVGRAEHDEARTVRPVAQAGYDDGYVLTANITWADTERGHGPTGTAIRTERPSVWQDIAADPRFLPWRAEALRRGYASVVGVPIYVDGRVFGALTIYASEKDAFDDDAVRLLIELTNDLGYGVTTLRARRALEAARAAVEQASRARDELLRIAAHELRTPLTPILGWAQILEKDAERCPARVARGIGAILRSVRREAQIVDDLIDVSHMVSGRVLTERRPVELGPIVEAAVREARPLAAEKHVQLVTRIAPGATLSGDARRLRQAAENLLSNALKFTPLGGCVSVEVAREPGALVLRVRDNGKGISAGDLPHVFEPFHPGDRSTTRAEGGLGLGLSIVRYIVEAHGGAVRAESAGPGRGATFVVELPADARS
jgi:signal transduction histidine kinase